MPVTGMIHNPTAEAMAQFTAEFEKLAPVELLEHRADGWIIIYGKR